MDPLTWKLVLSLVKKFWKEAAIIAVLIAGFVYVKGLKTAHKIKLNHKDAQYSELLEDYNAYRFKAAEDMAFIQANLTKAQKAIETLSSANEALANNYEKLIDEINSVELFIETAEQNRDAILEYLEGQEVPIDCNEADLWFIDNIPFMMDLPDLEGTND